MAGWTPHRPAGCRSGGTCVPVHHRHGEAGEQVHRRRVETEGELAVVVGRHAKSRDERVDCCDTARGVVIRIDGGSGIDHTTAELRIRSLDAPVGDR